MDVPRIYIVDDDPAVRAATRRLLRPLGNPVEDFASAERFLADAERVDRGCLVLDLSLPGMSGLQLQQRMAALGWALPIVFVTSSSDQAISDAAIASGAVAFLHKPFGCEKLLPIVRGVLAEMSADMEADGRTSGDSGVRP